MSTAFRITQRSIHERSLTNLSLNLETMARFQERLSSGRLINRPSDNPTGTVSAMQYRADIRRVEQFSRNAVDGSNWLGVADSTMQQVLTATGRIRELILRASNGSVDTDGRDAIAAEVDSLRQNIIDLANTKFLDRPIFAGTEQTNLAYDATGTYLGDGAPPVDPEAGPEGRVERNVAPGVNVRVNLTGPEVFGDPAVGDLFATLTQLSTDLRTNPANLSTDLQALDVHIDTIENQLAKLGARHRQIEAMRQKADDNVMLIKNGLSEVEDIDLPQTIVDLQLQEVAYRAALDATSRVIQPSLLDFLR